MTLPELFLTSVGRCLVSTVIYLNRNVDNTSLFPVVQRKVCIPVYIITSFMQGELDDLINNKINDFT
jgi:hypothetical protein